jgi:hypothetical protein
MLIERFVLAWNRHRRVAGSRYQWEHNNPFLEYDISKCWNRLKTLRHHFQGMPTNILQQVFI